MNARTLIRAIDEVSYWSGKAFAWLILGLTFVVSIEVFKRYILNMPTAWIFDFNSMLYGTLFMMCGAYALAQGAHVRADFVYTYLPPRAQAAADLSLYFLFFIPGILGLIYAGYDYASISWRIAEHSNVTAEGPPVYHFKSVIPIAGALVEVEGQPQTTYSNHRGEFAFRAVPGGEPLPTLVIHAKGARLRVRLDEKSSPSDALLIRVPLSEP